MALGFALIAWHVASLYNRSLMELSISHVAVMVAAIAMASLPLVLYGTGRDFTRYLENLAFALRGPFLGISCFVIGTVYFWTFSRGEPIFIQMGFMVVLLAYYEINSITNRFVLHITDPDNKVSGGTLLRLMSNQAVALMAVFVMAAGGIYLGLMGVVGFRSVWSVLILASGLMMLIVIMVKVRRL